MGPSVDIIRSISSWLWHIPSIVNLVTAFPDHVDVYAWYLVSDKLEPVGTGPSYVMPCIQHKDGVGSHAVWLPYQRVQAARRDMQIAAWASVELPAWWR